MEYRLDYDDPYKILAHAIVGFHQPAEISRILSDDAYIQTLVLKETRMADIGGWFLDCIIENILAQKERMEYMHELDKLSEYYYSKLDKERLRTEIQLTLEEAGIVLGDYSDAGNVLSANT